MKTRDPIQRHRSKAEALKRRSRIVVTDWKRFMKPPKNYKTSDIAKAWAKQKGLKVMGISCISNMGTGILNQKLSHDEVTETANKIQDKFKNLVMEIIKQIAVLD